MKEVRSIKPVGNWVQEALEESESNVYCFACGRKMHKVKINWLGHELEHWICECEIHGPDNPPTPALAKVA
jgi:hypothetical protein